ncbi:MULTISPECIES: HipA N-terminal domain-containing protein [Gordonia]|uniref:HipA N-terminal domain-containing protein n=1 Tax=Gordonia TaxID=2053 RepID=UPI001BCB88FD|nr:MULTISPECIES: HipA N-terminal domain-containing protein [Gordonia]HMS76398.1 HipA N-terminal domain-containing protein [Gordonia sp. (in: high G+C Gram-positive bacteria)]
MNDALDVYIDVGGEPVRAGVAYFTEHRHRVGTTFTYDPSYLARSVPGDLEPRLPRVGGQQYVDGLPGAFADSAPDRWGRNLIDKVVAQRSAKPRSGCPLPPRSTISSASATSPDRATSDSPTGMTPTASSRRDTMCAEAPGQGW